MNLHASQPMPALREIGELGWVVVSSSKVLELRVDLPYLVFSVSQLSASFFRSLWQQVCKIFLQMDKKNGETQQFELTYLKNARKCN